MLQTIFHGLTIGGILYIISIGLSLTFGAMGIVNFAHGLIYTLGGYILIHRPDHAGAQLLGGRGPGGADRHPPELPH